MIIELKVDVGWLDDNGNVDESLKEAMVDRIVASTKGALLPDIRKEAVARIHKLTDQWIMEQVELFCDRQVNVTDKWGDTVENHESVNDLLKSKFDDFLNGAVDEKGKSVKGCPVGNKRSRFDFVLEQKAQEHTKKVFDSIDRNLNNLISKAHKEQLEQTVTSRVVKKLVELENA